MKWALRGIALMSGIMLVVTAAALAIASFEVFFGGK